MTTEKQKARGKRDDGEESEPHCLRSSSAQLAVHTDAVCVAVDGSLMLQKRTTA